MISNFGSISDYTVYKTDTSGSVSINPTRNAASNAPQVRQTNTVDTLRDTYEPSSRRSRDEAISGNELKNIGRLLQEISSKLSNPSVFQRESEGQAQGQAQMQKRQGQPQVPQRQDAGQTPRTEAIPPSLRPMMRTDIPLFNQMYGYSDPAAAAKKEGPCNALQACKSLNSWAKTEYSQTEGFGTTYSPQELRDRISVLSEIENHITSAGPSEPQAMRNNPVTEKNLSTYKAMKKDPDRITRRSYFEGIA